MNDKIRVKIIKDLERNKRVRINDEDWLNYGINTFMDENDVGEIIFLGVKEGIRVLRESVYNEEYINEQIKDFVKKYGEISNILLISICGKSRRIICGVSKDE